MSEVFIFFRIALNVVLLLATCFGNTLVCVAIWRVRALHSVSNLLIFSLALADLLMTVVFVFRIVVLSSGQTFPSACHGVSEVGFTVISVIILHLCCISIDRLIAIQRPLRYRAIVTRCRMKIVIGIAWLLAMVENLAIPHVLTRREYEDFIDYYDSFQLCITTHNHQFENTTQILAIFIIVVYFIIPFVITLSSYAWILKVSCQQRVKLGREARLKKEKLRSLELKAAITLGIVIGAFLLCFLPLFVGSLYQQFKPDERDNMSHAMQILSIIATVSACVNPVVYTWRDREFRKSFKKLLTRNKEAIRKCKHQLTNLIAETRDEMGMEQLS